MNLATMMLRPEAPGVLVHLQYSSARTWLVLMLEKS